MHYFLVLSKNCEERIIAIISYITKDPSYFKSAFHLIETPENIQTIDSIKEISNYLNILALQKSLDMANIYRTEFENSKKVISNLGKKTDSLSNELNKAKEDNANLSQAINELKIKNVRLESDNTSLKDKVIKLEDENIKLKGKMDEMKQKIESMEEILHRIDLRDTVKMSLRYIYKVLYSKFPSDMKDVSNIWDQIDEVGKILSQPRFMLYGLISRFVKLLMTQHK